jgi:hypothetical protein
MRLQLKLYKNNNIEYHGSDEIELDLEQYIAGCVAQEIGNAHLEACKA